MITWIGRMWLKSSGSSGRSGIKSIRAALGQTVYGLTSLTPKRASPQGLLNLTREYWGIENGLHYRRDATLQEDPTRVTFGRSGHNLAILNNLTIGLCLRQGFTNLAKARRLFSAKPERTLELLTTANKPFL